MTPTLRALLRDVPLLAVHGELEFAVRAVELDSRRVGPGAVFVALPGQHADGHRYAAQAIAAGAAAVVATLPPPADARATWVQVADTRVALGRIAARFHGDPSAELALIGVTGTNGKTTITYVLESILRAAGCPAGVIGTINVRYGGAELPAALTTPEATTLQRTLREMRTAGVTHAVMEVSSHAIDLRRIEGLRFAAGVFTNLTRDHLDYHGDIETYAAVKTRFLVDDLPAGGRAQGAAINLDDPRGRSIAARLRVPLVGFSAKGARDAAVRASGVVCTIEGLDAAVATPRGTLALHSPLTGQHNAENVLAAVAAAEVLGLPHAAVLAGIAALQHVPGRLERVENPHGIAVFVDYAHTDDALDNVTRALRPLTTGRLITVFGCGGDRDRTKRPAMGAVAVRNSDLVVVTSDNPRTEEPTAILADILPGVRAAGGRELAAREVRDAACGVVVEPDRRAAIALALSAARPGDTVLLAGKGHEDYQILGKDKQHFDDREEARAALRARG